MAEPSGDIGRDHLGLKSLGLYQTQAEIDAAPLPISEIPRLGDIRYLDYNGDGLH
ncbi:hypothetical protein NXW20_00060 [Bacteroides faecis]|nr:hypothetical protein [Bacteroides faecis]MCS2194137.1 hypothetical protein [Bacteroides faecis]